MSNAKGQITRLAQRVVELIAAGRLGVAAVRWLRLRGFPLPMSMEAFAFDEYRRARDRMLGSSDLAGVGVYCKPQLVSIVLPVYNGEKYLYQALDSILAQTYADWELIVVDDGSADSTPAILREYTARDERIRVIQQVNQKLPRALSNGFRQAQGEFFTWTSDDNLLYPEFLARLVDCLNRHPDWDMVYANQNIVGEDGESLRDSLHFRTYQAPLGSEHIHLPKDPSELNTCPDNYLGAAFMYRSRAARLVGDYSPHLYTVEDYDYWLKINALLKLRHADFDQPIYGYRFHAGALTHQDRELSITDKKNQLIHWDDFRRDFYLAPLVWLVRAAGPMQANFSRQVVLSGQPELTDAGQTQQEVNSLGMPMVYIQFVSSTNEISLPPQDIPEKAFRVVVVTDHFSAAVVIPEGWDMYITTASGAEISSMEKPQSGWYECPEEKLFALIDVRARLRFVEEIERFLSEESSNKLNASVIICTNRSAERIEAAVCAAAQQTVPKSNYEFILVNNQEDQSLDSLIHEIRTAYFPDHPENCQMVYAPRKGLSHARNAGLWAARGEVICYLDDDALAGPDWLQNILDVFEDKPQVGVVGGAIKLRQLEQRPFWWFSGAEVYWSGFNPGERTAYLVTAWRDFPWGANWCARRQALLAAGGFRVRYGWGGALGVGGEEVVAALCIQKNGGQVSVAPRAVVTHHVDPGRFTIRDVIRRVLAGRREWYQLQKDLYIESETGIVNIIRRLGEAFQPFALKTVAKLPYLFVMEMVVFVWAARDWFRRFRRPVSTR